MSTPPFFVCAPLIRSQVFGMMMLSSLTHNVLFFYMQPHTRTCPSIIEQCLSFFWLGKLVKQADGLAHEFNSQGMFKVCGAV